MKLKEKFKVWRFERYWKKCGRKDFFTWVHRYFRQHSELLEDDIYKEIYDYFRNTLIAYIKKDFKRKDMNDEDTGKTIDLLADLFNRNSAKYVEKYKSVVNVLYNTWKDNPCKINDIRA